MKTYLTKKRRLQIEEINKIVNLLRWPSCIKVDINEIQELDELEMDLEYFKDDIVRMKVLKSYLEVDSDLSIAICEYFYPKQYFSKNRKKVFKTFLSKILDKMTLKEKLNVVKEMSKFIMPKGLINDICQLNTLRNVVAHSSRVEEKDIRKKIHWKGKSIFLIEGFQRFCDDMFQLSLVNWQIHGRGWKKWVIQDKEAQEWVKSNKKR